MKNALIIFVLTLPFLLLNLFVFDGKSGVLGGFILVTPFLALSFLLKKSHSIYTKEEIFKKVFYSCLITGVFYAIWMGTYQYLVINYFDPEFGQELLSETEAKMKTISPGKADEMYQQVPYMFSQPLFWIFNHLLSNFFFFSVFGLILGLLFKLKLAQQ